MFSVTQAIRVLIVAAYTTVYSYIQPYRSRLANHLEVATNLNFLLLLLISATSFFTDDFFYFPSLTDVTESSTDGDTYCGSVGGIAVVSWILMPFYYLPVLVALITTAVLASLYVRYNSVLYYYGKNIEKNRKKKHNSRFSRCMYNIQ